MLRFQDGDEQAFEELVRRNTSRVYALGWRFLGEQTQVEDLAQEVFIRIYRTVRSYKPTAKFSTWLYRIVTNLSLNMLRSRNRTPVISLNPISRNAEDLPIRPLADTQTASPAERIERSELAAKVASAVAELPDNQRIAIVLSKYEGKNYKEIADVLNCTTMAVKSLLTRARENLRISLQDYLHRYYKTF